MHNHFIISEIAEQRQKQYFCKEFGVEMDKIVQGPCVCGDFVVTTTTDKTKNLEKCLATNLLSKRIEFKNDISSLQYGSLYVEFAQTSDYWWTDKRSGHHKAILDGCILVISSGNDCYMFDEQMNRMFSNTVD